MKRTLLSLLSLCALSLYAQSDSLSTHVIDELVVEEVRQPIVRYSMLGKTYWSVKSLQAMPMSDPLRNIQLLPGVQTASENTGGVYVQGCNNSHNYTTINGAPVYYPMHLLGFFSTFNTLHYKQATFGKSVSLTTASRLGAEVGMETADTLPRQFGGDFDLGLLVAQGGLRIPIGNKMALLVSGRYSDVNLIYDKLINGMTKDNRIAYRLYDTNISLGYKPTDRDKVSVDYYRGADYANFDVFTYNIGSQLKWSNRVASARWQRSGEKLSMDNRLYYTAYRSELEVIQTDSRAYLPASIHTVGAKSELRYMTARGLFTYGGELMHHIVSPQAPRSTGSFAVPNPPQQIQKAMEGALFIQADVMLGDDMELIGGLRTSGYHHECFKAAVDPKLTLRYQPSGSTTWQLAVGTYTQYLHQVGFSSNGFPTEFWVSSNRSIPAQRSAKVSLGVQHDITGGAWRLSLESYFTRMHSQVEYRGNALDLLSTTYDLEENLVVGNGYNYGIDVMLQKNRGKLTGWIAYSWAKAPRQFIREGELVTYPSVHNREHDLNVVANYRFSHRWNFSATYIYATGTPYTEVKYGYVLGENVIVNYWPHNSSRYPALTRLDVSATCRLRQWGRVEHSIRLSVYNAAFAKNPISYRYDKLKGSHIYKRPVYIFTTAIPSVSYFVHF